MKKIIQIITVVLVPVVLVSCRGCFKSEPNVLTLGISEKLKSFDTVLADDLASQREVSRVYETLLKYKSESSIYELEPNLLENLPTLEGENLNFKIKSGVMFQKIGSNKDKTRELVCDDVVYSIKRVADPNLKSNGYNFIQGKILGLDEWREKNSKNTETDYDISIAGLECKDKYNLKIKLLKKDYAFLHFFAHPYSAVRAKEFKDEVIGTGAFTLDSQNEKEISYKKNANYRNEKSIEVDEVKVAIGDSVNADIQFDKDGLKDFSQIENIQTDLIYDGINLSDDVLKNPKLRKAIALAYDRSKIISQIYGGKAVPADSIIPNSIEGYSKEIKRDYYSYNLAKAKELLKEAGFEGGAKLQEINYDIINDEAALKSAELVKSMLGEAGIKIKIIPNEWEAFQQKLASGKMQMWSLGWSADLPEPNSFVNLIAPTKYKNIDFEKAYDEFEESFDSLKRKELLTRIQNLINEDIAIIPLVHRKVNVSYSKKIKKINYGDFKFDFVNSIKWN